MPTNKIRSLRWSVPPFKLMIAQNSIQPIGVRGYDKLYRTKWRIEENKMQTKELDFGWKPKKSVCKHTTTLDFLFQHTKQLNRAASSVSVCLCLCFACSPCGVANFSWKTLHCMQLANAFKTQFTNNDRVLWSHVYK